MGIANPILDNYNIVELSKLEGSLAGILAGFALTVSIILIERSANSKPPGRLARLSIASFLVAFVASFATAFNFIVIGAEGHNVPRLAVEYIPVSFSLAQSYVYLFMGITLALFEYRISTGYMRDLIGAICTAVLIMVGGNIAFSALWSIAICERVSLTFFLKSSPLLSLTLLLVAILPAILIEIRIMWSDKQESIWGRKFDEHREAYYIRTTIIVVILITTANIIASFMTEEVPDVIQDHLRFMAGLTVCLYSSISGVAVILLPRRDLPDSPSTVEPISTIDKEKQGSPSVVSEMGRSTPQSSGRKPQKARSRRSPS